MAAVGDEGSTSDAAALESLIDTVFGTDGLADDAHDLWKCAFCCVPVRDPCARRCPECGEKLLKGPR